MRCTHIVKMHFWPGSAPELALKEVPAVAKYVELAQQIQGNLFWAAANLQSTKLSLHAVRQECLNLQRVLHVMTGLRQTSSVLSERLAGCDEVCGPCGAALAMVRTEVLRLESVSELSRGVQKWRLAQYHRKTPAPPWKRATGADCAGWYCIMQRACRGSGFPAFHIHRSRWT
jgi:hypothetical protein